jgi:hypothetical protein
MLPAKKGEQTNPNALMATSSTPRPLQNSGQNTSEAENNFSRYLRDKKNKWQSAKIAASPSHGTRLERHF